MSANLCQIRPGRGRSLPNCLAELAESCQGAPRRLPPGRRWRLFRQAEPVVGNVGAVGTEPSEDLELARVRLACGRMVGGVDAMLEAYRFGAPEGPHREPWTAEYHREAVHVYSESLPWTYQRDVMRLFRDSAHAMTSRLIPAGLAQEWAIVTAYLREAARSIEEWLESGEPRTRRSVPAVSPEQAHGTPRVVHWYALAGLTTQDGIRRLRRACVAVKQYLDAEASPRSLGASERLMLERLASGAAIADLASELGYSERSMYRELSRLWDKLGVSGRAEGLHKATAEGLID